MDTIINSMGITIIYLALLIIGILYALFILIGAGLHDLHIPGFDLHIGDHDFGGGHDLGSGHIDAGGTVDHPTVRVPSLSPVTVASFVTAFGAFGLIALGLFKSSSTGSLIWAAGAGFIVAIIAHFAFGYFLIAPQGSSEVKLSQFAGIQAEVITPIPSDSVGEIAFVAQGGRITYTAKSSKGTEIGRGKTVDY